MTAIKIDPTVTFELNGDRKAVIDAYELSEFKRALFEAKGTASTDNAKTLTWETIVAETTAFVKSKCPEITLSPSEAIAVFENADGAWATKKKSWQQPTGDSPISPPFTDPRFAQD